jgi:hypothetical protein
MLSTVVVSRLFMRYLLESISHLFVLHSHFDVRIMRVVQCCSQGYQCGVVIHVAVFRELCCEVGNSVFYLLTWTLDQNSVPVASIISTPFSSITDGNNFV